MTTPDDVKRKLEEKAKAMEAEAAAAASAGGKKELTAEEAAVEAKRLRAEKKARLTQVLSRGILSDKLKGIARAATPEGYVGKFVRERQEDVMRYQNLGWGFTYREGAPRGLHDPATNYIRVGDVVLMTIQKDDHEILREIQADRVKSNLSKSRREYVSESQKEAQTGGAVPFDDSSIKIIKR